VYDQSLASFDQSGGLFSQQASPGFIELWSLQSRMSHQLRARNAAAAKAAAETGAEADEK
jgi:argininosuccinate synthase